MQVVQTFSSIKAHGTGEDWYRLLNLDPNKNSSILTVYKCNENDIQTIKNYLQSSNLKDEQSLIESFIDYCYQLDPYDKDSNHDLINGFLQKLFPLVLKNTMFIKTFKSGILFALKLELIDANHILRFFNMLKNTCSTNEMKDLLLFLGNLLIKTYLELNLIICKNIFTNLNTLNLDYRSFNKRKILIYKMNLSRYYLYKNSLIQCFRNVQWCLLNCLNIDVLALFLPLSIMLGRRIKFSYLRSVYRGDLVDFYEKVSICVHNGDLQGFNQLVDNRKDNEMILKLLKTKCFILIIRNLFFKVFRIVNNHNISFNYLKTALNFVKFKNNDMIIENLLVSLIDQNLIKGKILPNSRSLVLSKVNPFPKVFDVYKTFDARDDFWLSDL
ncbi:hypothetical protein CLIB1444_01S16402 [[Candida] jaroonii]|uniref:Uncharacterized protein n=1 Tax=[Candida] jaroonii TaxID=467808 RepID=A0ACA9Y1Q8_9ASCO|nr:hypothetical protein CLIB1444_01S16402 [[Candida] jaroonii]